MSTVTIPRIDIPLTMSGERISKDWYRLLADIVARIGGPLGVGTDDLSASAFEDAGTEETKAALYAMGGEFGQLPPFVQVLAEDNERLSAEIEELRGLVMNLRRDIENAQLGGVTQ